MTETRRRLRVFLCHSSQDKPIVRELYQRLNAEGWIDPWLDEEKLLPGQDWDLEIEKAAEAADAVIVCLSNNSVNKEGYVQRELKFVLDIAQEKPEGTIFIIPVRLEDIQPPRRLRSWQYADYFPIQQIEKGYQRVLGGLNARANTLGIPALKTETRKNTKLVFQNELSAIQEFKIRAGDFFGKPLRMRQIAADEIKGLSMQLETDEIIKFAYSMIPGEKVACGIALGEKILTDSTCSENPEIKDAFLYLLADKESRVRFRALQSIGYSKILKKHFQSQIEKLVKDENSSIKVLAKSMQKKIR